MWIYTCSCNAAAQQLMSRYRWKAGLILLFTHPEEVTWGRLREKNNIPRGTVGVSNHCSLTITIWPVSWKSPFPSQMPPAHLRRISGGSQRPGVISTQEQDGRNVVTFNVCQLTCVFKNTKGTLWLWIWVVYLESNTEEKTSLPTIWGCIVFNQSAGF